MNVNHVRFPVALLALFFPLGSITRWLAMPFCFFFALEQFSSTGRVALFGSSPPLEVILVMRLLPCRRCCSKQALMLRGGTYSSRIVCILSTLHIVVSASALKFAVSVSALKHTGTRLGWNVNASKCKGEVVTISMCNLASPCCFPVLCYTVYTILIAIAINQWQAHGLKQCFQ